jgi:hypothetical protein
MLTRKSAKNQGAKKKSWRPGSPLEVKLNQPTTYVNQQVRKILGFSALIRTSSEVSMPSFNWRAGSRRKENAKRGSAEQFDQ